MPVWMKFSARLLLFALPWAIICCRQPLQLSQQPEVQQIAVGNQLSADTAIENFIAPYKAQLDAKMNQVIGFAPEELTKNVGESTLGNFVTDLMLQQAAIYYKGEIDIAVTTNGGLRNPIPKGDITVGNIYELMPFENELVVVKVTGQTLQKLFDLAASKKTVPIANATYTIQAGRAFDIKIGGQPLQASKIYAVAVSDYLANGGDYMVFFKEGEKALILGITVRDAILNYIKALTAVGTQVTAKIEGRVYGTD